MTSAHRSGKRSVLIGLIVAGTMLLIGTLGVLTSEQAPTTEAPKPEQVVLVAVPGGVAATSTWHGPLVSEAGRATGFTHDELGAAVAASNIAPRITSAAGPDVYRPTLAEQCWGDVAGVTETLATALPRLDTPTRPDLGPRALHYRVIGGDPTGEHVVVSLLADTGQSRVRGGLSRIDLTLHWSGEDWQLRVPIPRPSIHPDTAGYTLLGPTP